MREGSQWSRFFPYMFSNQNHSFSTHLGYHRTLFDNSGNSPFMKYWFVLLSWTPSWEEKEKLFQGLHLWRISARFLMLSHAWIHWTPTSGLTKKKVWDRFGARFHALFYTNHPQTAPAWAYPSNRCLWMHHMLPSYHHGQLRGNVLTSPSGLEEQTTNLWGSSTNVGRFLEVFSFIRPTTKHPFGGAGCFLSCTWFRRNGCFSSLPWAELSWCIYPIRAKSVFYLSSQQDTKKFAIAKKKHDQKIQGLIPKAI